MFPQLDSSYIKFIVSLFLTIIMSSTYALQEDSKEKIFIIADSITYNYKTGFTIYEGHVKVTQGTTHIEADRLTTKKNFKPTIQEAIAYGLKDQAHYWTSPKVGDSKMHARAKIIKFYPTESNVTLEKNVVVTQGGNSFQGQLILYNRNDQTIFVPASNKGRAVVIYNPDRQ